MTKIEFLQKTELALRGHAPSKDLLVEFCTSITSDRKIKASEIRCVYEVLHGNLLIDQIKDLVEFSFADTSRVQAICDRLI